MGQRRLTRRERRLLGNVENSAFAWQLREFIREKRRYEGPASWILQNLNARATEAQRAAQGWPKTPNQAGQIISKLAPGLRLKGVAVSYSRHGKFGRLWLLEDASAPASAPRSAAIPRAKANTPDALLKTIRAKIHAAIR